MPRFEPFAAVRYAPTVDLGSVVAPPYDVLSDDDVAELRERDEHNIVRVDVPVGGEDRYDVAADALHRWLREGILEVDDAPSYTIYRMHFTDATGAERDVAGVLGALEVRDEGSGGVLPHERTTPKAKTDRLDLTRATAANLSPAWGLSLASGLSAELAEPGEQLCSVVVDGVTHQVERVTDPERIDTIREIVSSDDVLIADGHHRYAISRTYRDEVRSALGNADSAAETTLTFVTELVDEQLPIEAIHRLISGVDLDTLRAQLADRFDLSPAPAPTPALLAEMVDLGRLVLLQPDGSSWWLTPKAGAFDGLRGLDSTWLEAALGGLDATLTYQHSLSEVIDALASGQASAAILIRPTSIDEIRATARQGLLMPPKSTFFTPKLRTGLVVRPTAALPGRAPLG